MNIPPNDHIIWKFVAVIVIFTALLMSKYLGYESWDSWKDIRASLVETLVITIVFLMKYLNPKE